MKPFDFSSIATNINTFVTVISIIVGLCALTKSFGAQWMPPSLREALDLTPFASKRIKLIFRTAGLVGMFWISTWPLFGVLFLADHISSAALQILLYLLAASVPFMAYIFLNIPCRRLEQEIKEERIEREQKIEALVRSHANE